MEKADMSSVTPTRLATHGSCSTNSKTTMNTEWDAGEINKADHGRINDGAYGPRPASARRLLSFFQDDILQDPLKQRPVRKRVFRRGTGVGVEDESMFPTRSCNPEPEIGDMKEAGWTRDFLPPKSIMEIVGERKARAYAEEKRQWWLEEMERRKLETDMERKVREMRERWVANVDPAKIAARESGRRWAPY